MMPPTIMIEEVAAIADPVIGLHMGKKKKCDMTTLKFVKFDVSLDKNCRKLRQNLIKTVESMLKFYRRRRLT